MCVCVCVCVCVILSDVQLVKDVVIIFPFSIIKYSQWLTNITEGDFKPIPAAEQPLLAAFDESVRTMCGDTIDNFLATEDSEINNHSSLDYLARMKLQDILNAEIEEVCQKQTFSNCFIKIHIVAFSFELT